MTAEKTKADAPAAPRFVPGDLDSPYRYGPYGYFGQEPGSRLLFEPGTGEPITEEQWYTKTRRDPATGVVRPLTREEDEARMDLYGRLAAHKPTFEEMSDQRVYVEPRERDRLAREEEAQDPNRNYVDTGGLGTFE